LSSETPTLPCIASATSSKGFFTKLEHFRAIATRYDKLANTFLAAVQLVCVIFWLN
jgi:transposase